MLGRRITIYTYIIAFLSILTPITNSADLYWMGSQLGGDGTSWDSAQNWSIDLANPASVPTSSDAVLLNGDIAGVTSWPTISSAASAQVYHIFSGYGQISSVPNLTIQKNAALEIVTNGLHLGFVNDSLLTNYGTIDASQSYITLGEGNEWGYGIATIYMMGGQIHASMITFASNDGAPDYNYLGGAGIVYLKKGRIFAGSVQGLHYPGSLIDIEKGYLIIDGDARSKVDWWTGMGHITAYGGDGIVKRSYNAMYPNKTVVYAEDFSEKYGPDKWWDDFPRIVETWDLQTALEHNANIGFTDGQRDPGWGLYGQKITEYPSTTQAFQNAGLKSIGYFETFGDGYCFLAELDPVSSSPHYNTVNCHHWNWQLYNDGTTVWVGMKNFFDDEWFAQPWTNTHPTYGGGNMTYPDGTIATGYFNNDDSDPRNSRIYDASTAKDILGNLSVIYGYNETINAIDSGTGQPVGPLDGTLYILEDNKYASFVGFRKDSACPLIDDFTYASTLYAADQGMDGMWSDNYSPWDSFGNEPIKYAFGDWSVARFNDFLAENFTTQQLQNIGIYNLSTFDIRDELKSIATSLGWNENIHDLDHWVWDFPALWQDKEIWQIYLVYKRQVGTKALTDYHFATHQAAEDTGKNVFLVQGNDIPIFNLGWARDNLDMVSTEITASWNLASGPRGFMLPPLGRISPAYKAARQQASSRFVNVWFYNDGYEDYLKEDPPTYTANTNMCRVVYFEMLANNTLPMIHPHNPKNTGSEVINSEFFFYVSQIEDELGKRIPTEDIGIYYSTSSILNQVLPSGVMNFSAQPHQFSVWGWATALGQLQYQYQIVPEWKLDADVLNELKVLIIPESKVFDDADIPILQQWVNDGGRLIVTGASGKRHGEPEYFAINSNGYSLSPLTSVNAISPSTPSQLTQTFGAGKVLYIRDNVGLNYFNNEMSRDTLISDFRGYMTTVLSRASSVILTVGSSFPTNVGLTTFQDLYAGRFFIDIVNYNIDADTDVVTQTQQLDFTVTKPDWMKNKPLSISTQTFGPSSIASITTNTTDSVDITVSPVNFYVSVIINISLDPDTDNDNFVNFEDYTEVAINWLENCDAENDWCSQADIDISTKVDIEDLLQIALNWLQSI